MKKYSLKEIKDNYIILYQNYIESRCDYQHAKEALNNLVDNYNLNCGFCQYGLIDVIKEPCYSCKCLRNFEPSDQWKKTTADYLAGKILDKEN